MINSTNTNLHTIFFLIVAALFGMVPSRFVFAQTCVEPPSGIIAWWPFDETSGTITEDIIGDSPGAYAGGLVPVLDGLRSCLYLDGKDDYIAVADSDLWAFGSNNFTIELWANFDTRGGGSIGHPGDVFIANDEGSGRRKKWFFALGGGVLNFHINGPSTSPVFMPQVPFSPTVGQWYHLAVTRSGSTYTIYIDGIPKGSATDTRVIPNPDAPLLIGQSGEPWSGFMNGRLDEVSIYNRALTQEEIQAIVDAGSAGKCKDLRLRPDKGGNTGRVTVTITGGAFEEGTSVVLMKDGEPDIVGSFVTIQDDSRVICATFDLTGAALGKWKVAIVNPDGSFYTMSDGFTVEMGRPPEPWVDIIGLSIIRPGRTQSFHIFYGNRGNIDAKGVPIWIYGIPCEANIKLDFAITPLNMMDEPNATELSELPVCLDIDGKMVIPLIVSHIPAGSMGSLEISVTVPPSVGTFQLRVWANPPIFRSPVSPELIDCIRNLILTVVDTAPGVDCLVAFYDVFSQLLGEESYPVRVFSYYQMLKKIFLNCIDDVIPIGGTAKFVIDLIKEMLSAVELHESCLKAILGPVLTVNPIFSLDPNAKVGSKGYGEEQYISGYEPLRYTVFLENLETATAPAQEILITDQLDINSVDLNTISLGVISFGDKKIVPPAGRSNFAADVDLRPDKDLIVRFEVNLNPNTGILTWRFRSLDPETGDWPANPLAGFLPPNVNPPEGDGSVLFTVMPKQGLPTGTQIHNSATIVFDTNPPIETPEWVNTLDNSKPESMVLPLEPVQTATEFEVQWAGTDEGAGIRDYTIYVSKDEGPFTPWITDTNDTSRFFSGEAGKTYAFYSVARDQTGNRQDVPFIHDSNTLVEEAISEVTWKAQVSASGDDGYAFRDELQNLEFDFMKVGVSEYDPSLYYMSGIVFRDVNVPQGANVVSAQLKILSYDDQLTANVYGMIQAEATDNAIPFDPSYSIADRPRTEATVVWDHHEPWSPNTLYGSPDISEVIQEVINREGWSAGNSMVIFYLTRKREGGYRQLSSYDRGVGYAPKLEITYEP